MEGGIECRLDADESESQPEQRVIGTRKGGLMLECSAVAEAGVREGCDGG